jgi:hypothetical protein
MTTPRQPREARSSTAHTRLRHDRSPGSQAALPQRLREHHLDRADEPGCAVGDHQQRRPQAAGDQLAEEAGPGSWPSWAPGASPSSTGLP